MKHLFPYPPISARALAVIDQIERATSLKGLDDAFNTAQTEAFRHYGPSILIWLATMTPFAVLAVAANLLDWVGARDTWIFAFVPILGFAMMPVSEYLLRGPRRSGDETRIRDALNVWRVLERAERKA